MEQLARTFIFLEMLFVNLITTNRCARRKYSSKRVVGELTIYTAAVFLFSFSIRIMLEIRYINSAIIVLLGATYFFPLKSLYDESPDRLLSIMSFSWLHTMAVTCASLQISGLLRYNGHFTTALILQTIIYSISTPVVIKLVKNRFIYILKNIPTEMNKHFVILSIVEFAVLSIVYLFLNNDTNPYWKMVTIILIVLVAVINYHLIYIIVRNSKSVRFFKQLAYSDTLTGIKNRLALFLDCGKLISKNKPFTYIYMDLDNFKKINDTYGHSVGDDYLKQFTKAAIETIGEKGNIYRMSGDEFVCIYMGDKVDLLLEAFDDKTTGYFDMNVPFLGVSIGYAKYPADSDSLDGLIDKADKIMYKVKRTNKQEPV